MNLLEETLGKLRAHGLAPADVSWVGSRDGTIGASWERFAEVAQATDYDAGYGTTYIPLDLVVVFGQGRWLERYVYDGQEWWEYKEKPLLQSIHHDLPSAWPKGWPPRLVPEPGDGIWTEE